MAKAQTGAKDKKTKKQTSAGRATGTSPKRSKTSEKDESSSAEAKTTIPKSGEAGPSVLDGVSLPASRGKVGTLGGPKDRGIKADDKLALPTGRHFVFERIRSLDPKSFYCAMRWDYHLEHRSPEEGKRWWANKKLLVSNPENGRAVVVRAVDYGPHENTGLDISISPGAANALGVEVGDEVDIAFADQKAPLGLTEGD
jgi:hypothetical protein